MKYILIQNDGEIEQGAFELIGASTKRNQSGKIGFFGSGLKYSIAYMMRTGIAFKIFSGEQELKFTVQPETFREQSFDRICINGKPSSYTTAMGPTWKETWFVLREIYCNALDEQGCMIVKETENVNPSAGKTRIYIQLTPDLQKVLDNWDAYFSSDREVLYQQENVYTSSLGSSDLKGNPSRQTVRVYHKTDGVMFRKGVRVHTNKSYLYDYEFQGVNINEDRTASHGYMIDYVIVNLMSSFVSADYVASVLRTGEEDTYPLEYSAIRSTKNDDRFSPEWIEFSQKYLLVLEEKSGKYVEQIQRSQREHLLIPNHFAKLLKKEQPSVEIVGMDKQIGEIGYCAVEHTPKMAYLLKDVMKGLAELNYNINYPVEIVSFDDDTILGRADIHNKNIYLSERVFDMGRREIAMTLIEENEHIKSGHGDETRAFQTHLISSWLKNMEEGCALFF